MMYCKLICAHDLNFWGDNDDGKGLDVIFNSVIKISGDDIDIFSHVA